MSTNIINRGGWLVAGVLALFVVAALTGVVSGGPLDPPGAPAPTQKTLDQIAPVWSQVLASNDGPDTCHSSRFLCVLSSNGGVLDRETGLVWERVPFAAVQSSWATARNTCVSALIAGRKGWRVPSEEELESLLGTFITGHPFTFVLNTFYWTSTTTPDTSTNALAVDVLTADGTVGLSSTPKTDATRLRWCVRGGAAADGL